MRVLALEGPPDADLAAALARFEEGFDYPLGGGRRFRISHGEDHTRFYRSIGRSACFVVRGGAGDVRGVFSVARRRLLHPDGVEREAIYAGDLKVAPGAGRGRVLLALARAAMSWAGTGTPVFALTMAGTASGPERYTGRLGLPALRRVAEVESLRLRVPARGAAVPVDGIVPADGEEARSLFRALSRGRYATPPGDPALRAAVAPEWLVVAGGDACGLLEDTAAAKRLVDDAGEEIRAAHLSAFAAADPRAGAALVAEALRRAGERGFPAMWVTVPPEDAGPLLALLPGIEFSPLRAAVYAYGLDGGASWNVNTSEI